MRWLRSALPELAGRLLLEGLEAACLTSGAARGWILISTAPQRHDLLACLGTSGPGRLTLVGRIPTAPCRLQSTALESLCPFREPTLARVFPMGKGALFLEGNTVPPARLLEKVHLALERIEIEREAEGLRQRVQRLGEELQRARTPVPPVNAGRRSEPLRSWYSHAAGTLASSQLAQALPALAQRAASLLDADFAALLVQEDKRVRLWGGDLLRKELGPVFSARKLGSLGRRVLEDGESFVSSQDPARLGRNRLLSQLGIKNLLAVPLQVDDRMLGALLVGGMSHRDFLPEELDLARLMAYQSALFLENALLVSGADVERVVARAVLDSMADGVFTLDWEKRITSFNPAAEAITGWTADKAIGRTCEEVLRAQYLCGAGLEGEPRQPGSCRDSCPLLAMLADQKLMDSGLTVEGNILTNEGEARYVSSTYSVVADKGDLLGAVVLFRDITEKKAIEQMKSDYAAALSHDLKTPLTAMKGYAITLLRHSAKLDEETRRDALEVINSEIDRVTRMFDNLLHQARMEAGSQTRYIEPVQLIGAVKRVVTVHSASSRRHKLSFDVPEDLVLRADRDQLDQILNNLVSNAVKYSPGGCSIVITARPEGRNAYVEVKDDGAGIPADQLSIVFERFRRVQDRMSRRVSGSGLGLYITRMLVEAMEGEVGVQSEVGKGSVFWFRLPLQRSGVTAS